MLTAQLTYKILSKFFKIPEEKNRYFPTFCLSIIAINALAGIYWWHTQFIGLCIIPLATSSLKPFKFITTLLFSSMALYCLFIEYNYKKTQSLLYNSKLSGIAHINAITYNEFKNNYRISCSFTPEKTTNKISIQIFVPEKPSFETGARITLKDIKFYPVTNASYQLYLLKESIHGTCYSAKLPYTLIDYQKTIGHKIQKIILKLEQNISNQTLPSTSALFSSLFLGSKKYLENKNIEIKNYFNLWGINHFLARSGLHVTLILFFVVFICRIFQISFIISYVITLSFLASYALFSYTSVSFLRAIIAALLALWCLSFRVTLNPVNILLISLLILIIYNPFFILFLDFQLTFLLTFGLIAIASLDF